MTAPLNFTEPLQISPVFFLFHTRYLTILLYLSSVEEGGESTFPVADNRTYEEQASVFS